jgi:hypothetical protein
MKLQTLILFCCLCTGSFAQDLKQELTNMNLRLDSLPDYRITVQYAAGDTSDFFDDGTASVIVSPDGYFYHTDFAEMVINRQHLLIINEEERTMIWSENQSEVISQVHQLPSMLQGIDTLIAAADSVYSAANGQDRNYYLRFTNGYFTLVELTFRGPFLSQVNYHYNETVSGTPGITAVCHIAIDEHPVYDKQLLSSDFYLLQSPDAVVPTEQFKGYILIYNESIDSYLK